MVGILLIGFIVYKKSFTNTNSQSKGIIKILDHQMISPKKSLMVVKVNNEKFLIASGLEHTTFLAKLENTENQDINNLQNNKANEKEYFSQETRLNSLQKQFNELYNQEENNVLPQINEMQNKKEIIKNLLSNLQATSDRMRSGF